MGTANLGAGLSSGYVVAGSLSKTSVAMGAGGKTQISYIISGILVIMAMIGLSQTAKLKNQLKSSRTEFALGMVCFFGVLTLGVLQGVGLGVALSILVLIKRASQPGTAVLGRVPGEKISILPKPGNQ